MSGGHSADWSTDMPAAAGLVGRSGSARIERRVAHLMPWGTIGGTEIATLGLANALASDGIDSVMWCREDAPTVASFFAERGFETATYDQRTFQRGPGAYWNASRAMKRSLRSRSIDVVSCADLAAADVATGAAVLARLPLVTHVRNPYPWITPLQRVALLATNALVFVSQDSLRQFGRWSRYGSRLAGRIAHVVYDTIESRDDADDANGVDAVRREFAIPPEAKIVGMVARIAKQKDHLTLLRAAERVVERFPGVRFLIVGDSGPESLEQQHGAAVRAAVAASPAAGHFVFTGYRADVMRLTRAFDIAVLCSHFEGFGLTNLEAMMLGKPVVATDVGGVPEVVLDGRTGLLHRHEDAADLAAHLLSLLEDPQRASAMGAAGRAFAADRFGAARFRQDIGAVYRAAIDDGPRGPSPLSHSRRMRPSSP